MTKDFLAFLNYIEGLEVSTKEGMMLIHLFKQFNVKYGYAYPTYKNIAQATKTKSDATIEKTIDKLEKSGLIVVDRSNKNNRYYIVGIENFLIDSKAKKVVKKTKEVAKKTIEKVEEVATEVVEEVKTFIPTQKFNNANVVEESEEVVVDAPEVEEVNPIDRFKNMIFASMQNDFNNEVREVMQMAKAEGVEGGTIKCYERLVRIYGKTEVKKGIVNALKYIGANGVAYFSKVKTYLEELDKTRCGYLASY